MKNAILLGRGEPHWNEDGTKLGLLRVTKRWGHAVLATVPIRPKNGFKGREQQYRIYAVPVGGKV